MTLEGGTRSKGEHTRERILDAAERLVLAKGYSGTSIDDVLAATGLTKGAFFHHFKSKGELARVLVERFWHRDMALFEELWRRADARSDDPLQAVLLWFEMLEQTIAALDAQMVSCLFASYLYEREQFDAEVIDFIRNGFRQWSRSYETRFEQVLAAHRPRTAVTPVELAEAAICLIEGGFVLGQSYGDPTAVIRQSQHFRRYLQLLFDAA